MLNALGSILPSLLTMFNNPYGNAQDTYKQYLGQAQKTENPFIQQGQMGGQNMMNMLGRMQNPSQFLNGLMGQYQESPYAKYEHEQAMRDLQAQGASQGLMGSTPFMRAAEEQSSNISNKYLNDWLKNALDINNQALGGYGQLAGYGQNSANNLSNIYSQGGANMGALSGYQTQMNNTALSNLFPQQGSNPLSSLFNSLPGFKSGGFKL